MEAQGRNAGTCALVTGGAQGIGLAVARQLVAEGCRRIALLARSEEKGRRAVSELEKAGADVVFLAADLTDTASCLRAAEAAAKRFGPLNGLVNAAATSARGTLTDTTPELFDFTFATNVRGPFFLMQAVVNGLLAAKQPGSIVNVLSMAAHGGQPFISPYAASKGALATLTKNAANAFRKDRIRVNAVLPGWMDTPGETAIQKAAHGAGDDWLAAAEASQPMGQLVKPHQLAVLVAYMLSPDSGVMTGALVDYDQNVVGGSE